MNFRNPGPSKLVLATQSPTVQNMVIDTLRKNGVTVYGNIKGFDPGYPTLIWDGSQLTQTVNSPKGYSVDMSARLLSTEEFIEKFVGTTVMEVGDYQATFDKDEVKVGCQTIPYDVVKELYDRMTELRK